VLTCRWLKRGDRLRAGRTDSAPRPRQHMRVCNQAHANEDWTGPICHRPCTQTGVKRFSPLGILFKFDLVWDMLLDLMHTCKNFWVERIIPTFKGDRAPAKKTFREISPHDKDYRNKKRAQDKRKTAFGLYLATHTKVTFTKADMEKVDKRVKDLCGEQQWINRTLVHCEYCSSCDSPLHTASPLTQPYTHIGTVRHHPGTTKTKSS
jgi:hypothetical protein